MSRARELADLGRTGGISVGTSAPGSTGGYMIGVGLSAGGTPRRQLDVASGDAIVGLAITFGGSSGIISATAFHGDGSELEGVASAGLGTALGTVEGRGDDVIYYTDRVLNINDDTTITVPTSAQVAYTQYTEVVVADSKDLIISDVMSLFLMF